MAERLETSTRRRLIAAALAAAMGALSVAGSAQQACAQGAPQDETQERAQGGDGAAQPDTDVAPAGAPADGAPAAGQPAGTGLAVVSRERLLREAASARRLREVEEALTARLQREIDETKVAFAAEEAELARIRGEVSEAEFETRVVAFDQRVRQARRVAQERATALQKAFQDGRAAIVAALPAVIERLRLESGASVVLNGDQVLALDPAMDLTDRAIALFDELGPPVEPPRIDFSTPLSAAPDPPAAASPPEGFATPPALPLPGPPAE